MPRNNNNSGTGLYALGTPVPNGREARGLARFTRFYARKGDRIATDPAGARFTREVAAREMLSRAYNNRNQSYKGSSPTAHK